jgi:chromosome segregation ATPase
MEQQAHLNIGGSAATHHKWRDTEILGLLLDFDDCRAALAESQSKYDTALAALTIMREQRNQLEDDLAESQQREWALDEQRAYWKMKYDNADQQIGEIQQQHDALRAEHASLKAEDRIIAGRCFDAEQALASLRRQVGEVLKDAHMWMAALCGRMHADESCHPQALKNAQEATEKVRILLAAMEREAASGEPNDAGIYTASSDGEPTPPQGGQPE